MPQADEQADGYEKDMPAEEPVGQWESQLVQQEYAAHQYGEEAGPEATGTAAQFSTELFLSGL